MSFEKPKLGDEPTHALTVAERIAAAVVVVALIGLRVAYAFVFRVDSDEPQHLHVVWGWVNGLVQYRDFFDNHTPLGHMLSAPLFRVLGERADILIPMRLAMLPLFLFDLWCVYVIAARLWTARAGLWAAALTAFFPLFFFTSAEFRTDNLWVALWLLSLVILTGGEFKVGRAFLFGLVLGATLAASIKTLFLVASLCSATGAVLALRFWAGERFSVRQAAVALVLPLAGMLIIPGAIVAFFEAKDALPHMFDCLIRHNAGARSERLHWLGYQRILFFASVPVFLALAHWILRSRTNHALAAWQALILVTGGVYFMALRAFSPVDNAQDLLPFVPLFFISLSPFLMWLGERTARLHPVLRYAIPVLIVACELGRIFTWRPLSKNELAPFVAQLADVLRLTNPSDFVMDAKGETIFRRRPFYLVLEELTVARMKMGLIRESVRQRLIETGTCVVHDERLVSEDKKFVRENYLAVIGRVRVVGKVLGDLGKRADGTFRFHTAIPAHYAIVSERGEIGTGMLDGKPLTASQFLAPGAHELKLPGGKGQVAVVWAQAIERGFSPFPKQ